MARELATLRAEKSRLTNGLCLARRVGMDEEAGLFEAKIKTVKERIHELERARVLSMLRAA